MASVPYNIISRAVVYTCTAIVFITNAITFCNTFCVLIFPGTFLSPAIDAPPAYDQIFGISDLKEAKRESSNHATFAVKFCEVISGTSTYIGGLVYIATPSLEL